MSLALVAFWILAIAVLVPMAVIIIECVAAQIPVRARYNTSIGPRPACAVLIPAHDEEAGIERTIRGVQSQLKSGDRLVVVADNCQDRTAEMALRSGAMVIERNDRQRSGKGYALDWGKRFLEADPPAVVVVIDADCLLELGTLDALVSEAARGRAVQAAYVLHAPAGAGHGRLLSAFAIRLKNIIRPRGLARIGMPCLLTGSGMAFPWLLFREARLASGDIVEDMQLAIDLALAGYPPRFCPEARIKSELPSSDEAVWSQRRRWEHGHLRTLLTQVPKLLRGAIRERRFGLLALALELSVPPLSLLLLATGVLAIGAATIWLFTRSILPLLVLGIGWGATSAAVFAAWVRFGGDDLPLRAALDAPLYVLKKLPLYAAFFFDRQRTWNRTERARAQQSDRLSLQKTAERAAAAPGEGLLWRAVHELVEEQVKRTSDRPAVIFGDRMLTYAELNTRANQVAHFLRTIGVGPERLVGLCVDRSLEMVVGLLGILKAGGAYVPLDPEFPRERLRYYVQDSGMAVLLVTQRVIPHLPRNRARTICLDTDWDAIAQQSTDNPAIAVAADNVAYVIYTSGSTGKPKGVQVLHGAVANFLNSMRKQPGLDEGDILAAVTTVSFDIHVLEVWLPLIAGARVAVVSREFARDGIRLANSLDALGATILQATPTSWRMLLDAGWSGSPRLKALCGGELLTTELAERLLPRVGSLWNMYGPTETTVWSTIHPVQSPTRPIPIGRPIDNTLVHVVDEQLRPVPAGDVGELLIGGAGLARGYLHLPELTVERFIPDTLGASPGARLYRTGDLARFQPDGTLECLGRIDHQVKIRGFRIELGEIEAALSQRPDVKANIVVVQKASGAEFLAAYIIPRRGQACRPEELRQFLKERLPDYMVPRHFIALDAFPLTPNGKIDRRALADLSADRNGFDRRIVGPRDDAERDLLAIWKEVLDIGPISVMDNFFDLGGDSLQAAGLIVQIQRQLGHALPLGALSVAPTVEKLAAVLNRELEAGSVRSIVPFRETGSRPPLFMVAGVGGHVFTFHKFARLLGPDQPVYGLKAIGVDGSINPPDTVEEIATRYAQEIAALRPTGPYVVSGYSIGAIIAYELALQLRALDQRVDGLIVFDMLAPGYPRKLALSSRLGMHARTFWRLPLRDKRIYFGERMDKVRVRIRHWLGQGIRNAPDIDVEGLPQEVLKRVWLALSTAASRYRPSRPFDRPIILFNSAEGFRWPATIFDDPLYGWGRWTLAGVETQTVRGSHLELFHEQNIQWLAQGVTQSLGRLTGIHTADSSVSAESAQ